MRYPRFIVAGGIVAVLLLGTTNVAWAGVTSNRYVDQLVPYGGILPECADVTARNNSGDSVDGWQVSTYSYGGTCNNVSGRFAWWLRLRLSAWSGSTLVFQYPYQYSSHLEWFQYLGVSGPPGVNLTAVYVGASYWFTFGAGSANYINKTVSAFD